MSSAVGAGVTHVKEGDRVGVPWLYTACGHCRHCLGGWETLCTEQQNTGYSVNGGFAEYVLADPDYVGHLPANVGFVEIAPILCAGVTVYKGLKDTDTKPGEWVVDLGHRRARPHGGAVRQGDGAERAPPSTSTMPSSTSPSSWAPHSRSTRARQDPVAFVKKRGRRRAGRAGHGRLAQGLRAGAGHGAAAAARSRSPACRRAISPCRSSTPC